MVNSGQLQSLIPAGKLLASMGVAFGLSAVLYVGTNNAPFASHPKSLSVEWREAAKLPKVRVIGRALSLHEE